MQTAVTEQTIASFEGGSYFEKLIGQVRLGRKFVVEEEGKPVAAVVPLQIYNTWKKESKRFFTTMREAAKTANLSEEEADRLADEAVKAVRAQERAAKTV